MRRALEMGLLSMAWILSAAAQDGSGKKPAAVANWPDGLLATLQQSGQYFVGPEGKAENPGTREGPWDVASALGGKQKAVKPGDVIWVLGGTYKGCFKAGLKGAEHKPIIVRAVPGDRVTLDGAPGGGGGSLEITGQWAWFWGLELTNSKPDRQSERPPSFWFLGPNCKLINCVAHDGDNNGFWASARESEIYGTLIYGCGNEGKDRGHGHGIYSNTDKDEKGTKKHITDNILCNGFSFGIHCYTTNGNINGYDIVGNIFFCNGVGSKVSGHKDDCLVGGMRSAERILLKENLGWAKGGAGRCVQLGYAAKDNKDVTLLDNYFAGQVNFSQPWEKIEMKGNTFIGPVSGNVDTARYPDNVYKAKPQEPKVFVRANRYEPGRAHIAVFNFGGASTVAVDVGSVVPAGAEFEIRNAQNYYAEPVAKGVFSGRPVPLPMVGLEPAQPVGQPDGIGKDELTGKDFNVFVLHSWSPGGRGGVGGGVPERGKEKGSGNARRDRIPAAVLPLL